MLLFFVALLATAVSAPYVRAAMLRHGVLDVPNHRSSHVTPVARGGGWACVVGLGVGVVAALSLGRDVPWPAIGGAIVLGCVGFADDRRDLPAGLRLAAQAGTGLLVGVAVGGLWGAVAGALLFAALVNVVNFMDGINGITAVNMAVWGATSWAAGRSYDVPELVTLGALTAGCALGFLPWNAPTARLFLGDVGSYLFGALVAGGVVVGWHHGVPPALLLAPMSIYLVDTGSTLVRRAVKGESLLTAHRDHVYQRVVAGGGLAHLTVAAITGAMAATVTAMWVYLDGLQATIGTVVVAGTYLALPRLVSLRARGPASEGTS